MGQSAIRHWDAVYSQKDPAEVSWFEASPRLSLELIDSLALEKSAPIIDVGGGASRLAGALLERGFEDVTVADISERALGHARARLAHRAEAITWEVADVRNHDFGREFALWHDRAVLHFMVEPDDQAAYLDTARRSVMPGGHAIVATFAPDGPAQCSGLPVRRYSAEELRAAFGSDFTLAAARRAEHETPSGASQRFTYVHLQRTQPS